MIFGSISYLNLLPFQVYLKKYLNSTQQKQMLKWHKGVPASINKKLKKAKVNSAFISIVYAKNFSCVDLGIVANGAVFSVFVIPNQKESLEFDTSSASSNILAKILGLKGEVIIGDRALKYYLEGGAGIDLSFEWKKRFNLPFVFARLCYNKKGKKIKKLIKNFKARSWKIPYYILKKEAKKRGITPKELKWYLQFINYEINYKEKKSIKIFQKKAKRFLKEIK